VRHIGHSLGQAKATLIELLMTFFSGDGDEYGE